MTYFTATPFCLGKVFDTDSLIKSSASDIVGLAMKKKMEEYYNVLFKSVGFMVDQVVINKTVGETNGKDHHGN